MRKLEKYNKVLYDVLESESSDFNFKIIISTAFCGTVALFSTVGFSWSKLAPDLSECDTVLCKLFISSEPLILQLITAFLLFLTISTLFLSKSKKYNLHLSICSTLFLTSFFVIVSMLATTLTVLLLKYSFGVPRPNLIISDMSTAIYNFFHRDTPDLPSGFASRQVVLFLLLVITIRSLSRERIIGTRTVAFLISSIFIISSIVITSRVLSGHHSYIGVAGGIIWGTSFFWLGLIILPTRKHIKLASWHVQIIATWTLLCLLALATQGGNIFGGLMIALVIGIVWELAYLNYSNNSKIKEISESKVCDYRHH